MFNGLIAEMRELSKKKADATLSKGKVRILNRCLDDIRQILLDEPEAKFLDELDDDQLPQNSDAVLVMVQYETALSSYSKRYHSQAPGYYGHVWITEEIDAQVSEDERA
ncbi:hypothetical protein COO20_21365 [Thalassospira marina]|uniref:Uncharacterized protein n=1 Tax=Thalassospira marina TaxID=2048283 RepID=A0A2N3KJ45_9PROT|nr:hypothetical protein COO20_21365 [Thalassospira marina]